MPWNNGIFISFYTDKEYNKIIWPNRYMIKQNKWKSKRRRVENIQKVSSLNGEYSICSSCDGSGFSYYNFYAGCNICKCTGLIDWISRIR